MAPDLRGSVLSRTARRGVCLHAVIERAHALQDEGRSFVRTYSLSTLDAISGSGGEGEREGPVNSVLILRDQTVFHFQPRQRRMMVGLSWGDPG